MALALSYRAAWWLLLPSCHENIGSATPQASEQVLLAVSQRAERLPQVRDVHTVAGAASHLGVGAIDDGLGLGLLERGSSPGFGLEGRDVGAVVW